ncbi:hypothetical protein D3C73_217820 [compost metagenome]
MYLSDLLNAKKILALLLIAFLSFIYTDYLTSNVVGVLLSYGILVSLVVLSLINFKRGVLLYIYIALITPQFSRDFVQQVVDSDNTEVASFYSFHSLSLFGFSLSVLMIIFLGVLALYRLFTLHDRKVPKYQYLFIGFIVTLFVLSLLGTFISSLRGNEVDIRSVFSDVRIYIVWICAILVVTSLHNYNNIKSGIISVIFLAVITIGLRTIIFLLHDYFTGSIKLELSTQPYIAYPILLAAIIAIPKFSIRCLLVALSMLAAISMKRDDLAFVALSAIFMLLLPFFIMRSDLFKRGISAVFILFSGVFALISVLFIVAPDSLNFLLYKLNFFTNIFTGNADTSGSAMVRWYEFINITSYGIDHVTPIIIGNGLGGYFDFSYTGFPIDVGVSDYSFQENISGRFQRPHTFISYLLLKGGIVSIIAYLSTVFMAIKLSFTCLKQSYKNVAVNQEITLEMFLYLFMLFYSIFCLNMFWQPIHAFTFMVIFSIISFSKRVA